MKGTEGAWKKLYSDQGITVEYKTADCIQPSEGINMEEVYLKFTNTTDKLIYIDWQFDLTYGDKCYNCDGSLEEMSQTLKLEPNKSIEGKCGDSNDLRLRLFSKFLNMENITVLNDFHVKVVAVREAAEEK